MTLITLPLSVRSYLTDDDVRAAIDHMKQQSLNHLPADIRWQELPVFYRAQLATVQLQAEWGIFAHELWMMVWAGQVDPAWAPFSPADQGADGHVALAALTEAAGSLWFGRAFQFQHFELWASLRCSPGIGMEVFFALQEPEGDWATFSDPFRNDDEGGATSLGVRVADVGDLDVSHLRDMAAEAYRQVMGKILTISATS